MRNGFDSYDTAYYRSLLDHLLDDFAWVRVAGAPTRAAAATRAATHDGSIAELHLSHLYTDATMTVTMPDYLHGSVARVVIDQPLDPRLPSADDGFVGSLAQSHERIADTYESEYVQPVADPTVVLTAEIPAEYSEQKLYSMMTAISATVFRIQRLHEDVSSPVSDVLAGRSTHSNGSSDPDCSAPIGG